MYKFPWLGALFSIALALGISGLVFWHGQNLLGSLQLCEALALAGCDPGEP